MKRNKTKETLYHFMILVLFSIAIGEALYASGTMVYAGDTELPIVRITTPLASIQTPTESIKPATRPTPKDVEAKIRQIAKDEGYTNVNFLVALAKCESTFRPWKDNDDSGARGLFQIMPAHKDVSNECAHDITCSTKWTIQQLKLGHASAWECTKKVL